MTSAATTAGVAGCSFTEADDGSGVTGACGFLRSQPNRSFFSAGFSAEAGLEGAGVFLSSLEPNMEDGYLKGATRRPQALKALLTQH